MKTSLTITVPRVLVLFTLLPLGNLTGCATQMTVRDFVHTNLHHDTKLDAVITAADAADKAYNLVADTPAAELEANPKEVAELVNRAHDAWRKAKSYRTPSTGTLVADGVILIDPAVGSVLVDGASGIRYRVHATARGAHADVRIDGIETSRGVPMLSFDEAMNPSSVQPDFSEYLAGDRVHVGGGIGLDISRFGGAAVKTPPVLTPTPGPATLPAVTPTTPLTR